MPLVSLSDDQPAARRADTSRHKLGSDWRDPIASLTHPLAVATIHPAADQTALATPAAADPASPSSDRKIRNAESNLHLIENKKHNSLICASYSPSEAHRRGSDVASEATSPASDAIALADLAATESLSCNNLSNPEYAVA